MFDIDTIHITPKILSLISEIDEFKGAGRALGTLAPERLNALRHVATIENIASSTRIEGSKLSDREVEQLLGNLKITSLATRDKQEVVGYAEVIQIIFNSWEQIPIDENHIKQLHKDLLKYSSKDDNHRGKYKTLSNNVAAFDQTGKNIGIVFETVSPFDTPKLMKELIQWTLDSRDLKKLHSLLVVAIFTVVFLEIHPFQDGNGRLSRILTTLLLLQEGYAYVPYSSLESVVERLKEEYYSALRQTQKTIRGESPDWGPWISFFLQSLLKQKKNLEKKIVREKILMTQLPELSVKILEHAREHGRITIGDAIVITGVSRNTLKSHFQKLVRDNHLEKHGIGKGSWYTLP